MLQSKLPPEIQLMVVQLCSDTTLNNLILTCKQFHSSLNALLYERNVRLDNASSIIIAIEKYNDEEAIIAVIDHAERAKANLEQAFDVKFEKLTRMEPLSFRATLLYAAAVMGHAAVLKHLLAKGINMYAQSIIEVTFKHSTKRYLAKHSALFGALWAKQRAIASCLLEASLANVRGICEMLMVSEKGLLSLDELHLEQHKNFKPPMAQILKNHRSLIEDLGRTWWPENGIHLAAAANSLDILCCMNRDQVDASCALTYAINAGSGDTCTGSGRSIVFDLIDSGFDVDAKRSPLVADGLVRRPLAQACINGQFDVALALVKAHAQIFGTFPMLAQKTLNFILNRQLAWSERDRTALTFAQELGRRSRAEILVKSPANTNIVGYPDGLSTFDCFLRGILSPRHGHPAVAFLFHISGIPTPHYIRASILERWRAVKQYPKEEVLKIYPRIYQLLYVFNVILEIKPQDGWLDSPYHVGHMQKILEELSTDPVVNTEMLEHLTSA